MTADTPGSVPTLGIVYPGEMGSTLGRLLAQAGVPVVTTAEGRSPRTRQLAEEAGLSVLPRLRDVAERADVVLSTVSPAAAVAVAGDYLASRPRGERRQVYVDLNSIAPDTARQVGDLVRRAGLDFVDGAIHGLASALPERGTVYLSGPAAAALAAQFGKALRVKVLDGPAGQASAFKMMISGMAKGVVALFVEMSLAARRGGLLDDLLACYRDAYPGIMALVDRLLPTYPRHAVRRAEEARAVEETIRALGVRPCLARGARDVAETMARAGLRDGGASAWSVPALIEALADSASEAPASAGWPDVMCETPGLAAETANVLCPPAPLA